MARRVKDIYELLAGFPEKIFNSIVDRNPVFIGGGRFTLAFQTNDNRVILFTARKDAVTKDFMCRVWAERPNDPHLLEIRKLYDRDDLGDVIYEAEQVDVYQNTKEVSPSQKSIYYSLGVEGDVAADTIAYIKERANELELGELRSDFCLFNIGWRDDFTPVLMDTFTFG